MGKEIKLKSELKINDGLKYEFDDQAEFKDKKFISFHKESKFKDNVKHQNLTIRLEDWGRVSSWIIEACSGAPMEEKGDDIPF